MGLDVDALRVLRETMRVYGDCRTYVDRGRVTVYAYDSRHAGRPTRSSFATVFRRPDRLRFDVREIEALAPCREEAVVCWDGRRALTWRPIFERPLASPHLERAVAEAAGLPAGGASYVLHLLLGRPWRHAPEHRARWLGRRALGDDECDKLQLGGRTCERCYTLWIDVRTHLVRRILEVAARSRGEEPTQRVFRLEPRVDASVDERLFAIGERPGDVDPGELDG